MATLDLNVKKLDALKPTEKRFEVFDESLPGFSVRVTPDGRKTFSIQYRCLGRWRRMTIGSYPTKKLADAREEAREALRKASNGEDPAAEKKQKRVAETFGDLAKAYIEGHAKAARIVNRETLLDANGQPVPRKKSWAEDERILRVYFKSLTNMKAAQVRRADIRSILNEIAKTAPIQANRALAVVRKMFNWAIQQDVIENSPCTHIPRPGEENQRDRTLSDEEIKKVWKALNEDSTSLAASMKLRLITAQRGGEVISMEWTDIDLKTGWWTIPAEKSKNGSSHRVWLSAPAMRILKDLEKRRDENDRLRGSRFVFPNPRDSNEPMHELQKAIQRVRASSGIDFNGHDLRRTAATKMGELGILEKTISRVLNHVLPGESKVTPIYNRYKYDTEKKDALDKWAKRLTRIVSNLKATAVAGTTA